MRAILAIFLLAASHAHAWSIFTFHGVIDSAIEGRHEDGDDPYWREFHPPAGTPFTLTFTFFENDYQFGDPIETAGGVFASYADAYHTAGSGLSDLFGSLPSYVDDQLWDDFTVHIRDGSVQVLMDIFPGRLNYSVRGHLITLPEPATLPLLGVVLVYAARRRRIGPTDWPAAAVGRSQSRGCTP